MSRAIVREREAEDAIFRNLRLEGTTEAELERLGLQMRAALSNGSA
jgi:hypothetical protein